MGETDQPTPADTLDALLPLMDEGADSGTDPIYKASGKKLDEGESEGNGGEGEGEDEEEREMCKKNMRKNIRNYMKANEDELNEAMNEMGYFKAQVAGAAQVADKSDAPLTALDGTDIFKAFSSFADASLKMMKAMNERMDGMIQLMGESDAIIKAEGRVLSDLSRRFEDVEAVPIPRVGVTGQGAVQSGMQDGIPMTKAQSTPMHIIKSKLLKAAQDSGASSDRYQHLLETISHVEMAKDATALSPRDLQTIEGVLA